MSKIRIAIADDHPVFRNGLQMLLEVKEEKVDLVSTVGNGKEACDLLEHEEIDVFLMDIKMPVMDGVEAAAHIASKHPKTKIIMLTTFDERNLILNALKVGAAGYLLKDETAEKILNAIESVYNGNVLISPEAVKKLTLSNEEQQLLPDDKIPTNVQDTLNHLSDREQEVFYLLAYGKHNPDIADDLGISERTVRNYVSRIYDVIGVHKRSEAIKWAKNYGLV